MDWLRQEPKGSKLVKLIFGAVLLKIIIGILAVLPMMWIGIEVTKVGNGSLKILSISFPFIVLIGVMIEELIFRFAPLWFSLKMKFTTKQLAIFVLLVSAFFGYIHGGMEHVFIQGAGGVVLSVVFLKCGGMNKNYRKAYICSTTCHYLFNMVILIPAGIMGLENF